MKENLKGWCKSNLLFLVLLLLFFGFSFDSILDKPPTGQHLWRQTDCLSITQHYAEGASLFEPEMHAQLADENTSGKTAGEFPILYYAIGKVWSFFGQNILTYRLIYLAILFFGVFALFKSLQIVLKDQFWSIALTLLLISSPTYIFYSVSFLTDGPAYSFTLIALYFFTKYSSLSTKKYLYYSIVFFSLAGLIKVSSLIAFIFIGFIYVLEIFPVKTLGSRKLFQNRKFESLLLIIVPVVILSWYVYAHYYNELHHFKYTFNNIFPLWLMNSKELHVVLAQITDFSSHIFYARPMIYVLALICLYNLFSFRKTNLFAYTSNVVILFGSFIYFVLWAPLMGVHDYYYNALLILTPAIIVPFIWNLKQHYIKIFNSIIFRSFASLFIAYNLMYCASIVQLKGHSSIAESALIKNEKLLREMEWYNWNNTSNLYRLTKIEPELQKLNIKKSDKVIVLPDDSFNTTLYLINRKGWTNFMHYSNASDFERLKKKGAKYLFIIDDSLLEMSYLQPSLKEQIGEFHGVKIYKL